MKAKRSQPGVPEAHVTLRQMPGTQVWFWVVDACPLCGTQHIHAAGGRQDDPEDRLGPVTAPCDAGRQYRLSLPPKPARRGGKRAQSKRERRDGRRWPDDE